MVGELEAHAPVRLTGFLDLSEGFIELLEYAFEKPLLLIPPILDAFFIYQSSKKTGRVIKDAGHEGKADMGHGHCYSNNSYYLITSVFCVAGGGMFTDICPLYGILYCKL